MKEEERVCVSARVCARALKRPVDSECLCICCFRVVSLLLGALKVACSFIQASDAVCCVCN